MKKMNKSILMILTMITFTVLTACHKEGTGGKSSISGNVKHHDEIIPNATVYIKYGATELPGTSPSSYDASTAADANGHYEFKNLRKGDYFLYGVGFDTDHMETVTGGISVKLKYNKETTTDVPVTE